MVFVLNISRILLMNKKKYTFNEASEDIPLGALLC